MLGATNDCVVSQMFFSNSQKKNPCNFTMCCSENDRPVTSRVFFLSFLKTGTNFQVPADKDISRLTRHMKYNGERSCQVHQTVLPWKESYPDSKTCVHPTETASLKQFQDCLGIYHFPSDSLPAMGSKNRSPSLVLKTDGKVGIILCCACNFIWTLSMLSLTHFLLLTYENQNRPFCFPSKKNSTLNKADKGGK